MEIIEQIAALAVFIIIIVIAGKVEMEDYQRRKHIYRVSPITAWWHYCSNAQKFVQFPVEGECGDCHASLERRFD